ncbi:hypothetical protein [Nocardioides sp. SYSU DS0651]|uniref:hypothetical protein n=1 Tax=Nocardioides sp. SYSU DS0651 TaxID=3415955 RepID=UPI003F4B6D16
MTTARLAPMAAAELEEWRAARAADGDPLPEPPATGGDRQEALVVLVDDVAVGGLLLQYAAADGRTRCLVRVLQTTLPPEAERAWRGVIAALEAHARAVGAVTVATAVDPALAGVFGAAGFQATMATVGKRLDPAAPLELQEDRRVAVRPMEPAERRRFVVEVRDILRSGMERAGVVDRAAARLDAMEERLVRLADDPPPAEELLMVGTVDGRPVGRAWATLVPGDDGALDFHGNTIDLFPEHRGQGLTRSFLGALRRHVDGLGVRDVRLRVYGHDAGARRTFLTAGAGIGDVHLRKDLR